jgi:glycine/D-amino acid oxidase-like deaminating enzyme
MGFTESELPIIDCLAAPVPTVVVGGFSGHGMGLGFNAGREAAALVTGEKAVSFFGPIKHSEIVL